MVVHDTLQKVKLIAGVTVQNSGQIERVESFLTEQFGAVDLRTPEFAFHHSDYYKDEMGEDLRKLFFSFERLVIRERLPEIKITTNRFETETSKNGNRTVNIDPGYLSEASLILASTKNFCHRIYLGEGIFGECHLIFKDDEFHPQSWTYPDYKEKWILEFFVNVRKRYYSQMLEEPNSGRQASQEKETLTYKDSGVDIAEGDKAVERIKTLVRRTYGKNVLSDLGKFGGFYAPDLEGYKEPVLVSSVDGVGTKLKVAIAAGIHTTIGADLVNHCVNDILCCGARPLFFLDYLAFGKLDPSVFVDVVSGFSEACQQTGCALIGGETAEMPDLYSEGDYDISGTIVGIVDRKNILDGSKIEEGDLIIGLPSSGLHTNGYALARKAFFDKAGLNVDSTIPGLSVSVGEELLKVHRCYYPEVYELIEKGFVHGIAHITGGGLLGNINRLISPGMKAEIDWDSWEWLPVFEAVRKYGNVPLDEMRRVFNLGIGLAVIASEKESSVITGILSDRNVSCTIIGKITGKTT